MKYSDLAAICVLLVMLITTIATWILSWAAGVVMLCIWLSMYAMSAHSLANKVEKGATAHHKEGNGPR